MNRQEELKYLDTYNLITGDILTTMAYIDHMVTKFLTIYFCPTDIDKQGLLWAFMRDKIRSFDATRELFEFIIKKERKDFIKAHPSFLTDLKRMQILRNKLAHAYCIIPKLNTPILEIGIVRKPNSEKFITEPTEVFKYDSVDEFKSDKRTLVQLMNLINNVIDTYLPQ